MNAAAAPDGLRPDGKYTRAPRWLPAPPARCWPACALALGRHFHCPAITPTRWGDYASPQDQLVLALKFGHALPLAGWLAARLAAGLPGAWAGARPAPPDLIAPIPLSPQRLAARGFNQAWEIARPLARHLGLRPTRCCCSASATPAASARWTWPPGR
ncbi:methyltransferase [Cupriavidus necator N-1]|uniref:Methyltransferase n=1 Tax=Cupriavidus necator (strain ATCC 43291 / DSM 13513 / CCUG 52238 / LMG 8453 / N-1) TaxID=1042878 RepID=G0EUL1_CUPNN|nr:ComF family protein [Cupriavidus necator]AEI75723.1 methyltransferase [Cupriavidus necator N-1]MDX6012138.1 ComF family protein [Cupriavidus necator]